MMTHKIKDYREKMFNFIKKSFPDLKDDDIYERLDNIIEECNTQLEDMKIDIHFFDQVSHDLEDIELDKLETFMNKKGHIFTKYGTSYTQHAVKEALESQMLDDAGNKRKIAKKEKFKHINDEDPTLMKMFDAIQQTLKASIMNSYYGVLTAGGSIFRDLDCGESVTACGEEIIMSAIDTFEKFLTENIHFYSPSDVITYITNIINEDYQSEINFNVKKKDLIEFLNDHFYDKDELFKVSYDLSKDKMFMNFLSKLTQTDIDKVFYKNRLFKFLEDSDLYVEFEKIFTREIPFLNPNGPNNLPKSEYGNAELEKKFNQEWDFNKAVLEEIWFYLKDWVFYNYLDYNKYTFCKKGKRRCVLTVDTDSNFLFLKPAYDFFHERIECVDESEVMKVVSVNCITYIITKVINEAYLKFGKLHFVEEKYRPRINMKNEFLLSRLLMTKNKKNYASAVLMQEGNLIEKKKIDMKGLAIKKSNTNKFVSEYFKDMLKNDIILSKDISYSVVIRKYFDLIDIIKNSLRKGETKFTTPSRANEIEGYKNPVNIMTIRGVLTWNILYPENEIVLPENVNLIKLFLPENYENIRASIVSYCEENDIEYNEDELEVFLDRLREAFNIEYTIDKDTVIQKALMKDGILNILSLPKNIKEVPVFIRPFMNIDTMVYDHLNAATIILDCLGIQTPEINDVLVPTNFIKI